MERDALSAERTLRYFTSLEDDDPRKKAYFVNLRLLRFMRACFDAVCFAYQMVRRRSAYSWQPSSRTVRALERLKVQLLVRPEETARALKATAGFARGWFFGQKLPQGFPWQALVAFPCKYMGLIYSYIGRSLPPPPENREKELSDLVARLTGDPTPEVAGWRQFCRNYLREFRPEQAVHYTTIPSYHGSLGYTRRRGGFHEAVRDLVTLGCALTGGLPPTVEVVLADPKDVSRSRKTLRKFPGRIKADVRTESYLFAECIPSKEMAWSPGHAHLKPKALSRRLVSETEVLEDNAIAYCAWLQVAVDHVLDRVPRIPVQALYADERGLKVRLPTKTLAAANLVHQLFRRAADSHLIQDRTCSADMGGKMHPARLEKGPYYSMDLTSATDKHPFWLINQFYEEVQATGLHPQLNRYTRHRPKLLGSKHLVTTNVPEAPVAPDLLLFKSKEALDEVAADRYNTTAKGNLGGRGSVGLVGIKRQEAQEYVLAYNAWLDEILALPGNPTTQGGMMGDASSFPLMPMISRYAASEAGIADISNRNHDSRQRNCGDDSLVGRAEPAAVHKMERVVVSCGGTLSRGDPSNGKPNKIYYHTKLGLFKEIPYLMGQALPVTFLSLLTAPPGGSKAELSWFTQAAATREHLREVGLRSGAVPWRLLPFQHTVSLAWKLGVPVREETGWGGIRHPTFPHGCEDVGLNSAWLAALNSVTLTGWACGSGFSILPSSPLRVSNRFQRKYADWLVAYSDELLSTQPLGQNDTAIRPTLAEAAAYMSAGVTAWELYTFSGEEPTHTPSVEAVSRKFSSTVYRKARALRLEAVPYWWTEKWDNTRLAVAEKKLRFLTDPTLLPLRHRRFYGLEPAEYIKTDPNGPVDMDMDILDPLNQNLIQNVRNPMLRMR
jgi:hypothetical protein